VEDYKSAIARGRQLKQIDRQIKKLQQQLEQPIAKTTNTTRQTSPLVGENDERGGEGSHTPPFQTREGELGGLDLSEPNSIKCKVMFTDLAEQERLVKEVLANSQVLRNSLRQSVALGKRLGARIIDLRKGHPH
jgi:hypothetical protein